MTRPLHGITVVSLEQAVAAPFARQLADLGARVIKIERPGTGDFARGYDRFVHGQSSYYVWLNRSKESLTLDLKSTAGRAILEELRDRADVFVQNLAPGAVEALAEWMGQPLYATMYGGHAPARAGVAHATVAPYGPYQTGDGSTVLLAVQSDRWRQVATPTGPVPALLPPATVRGAGPRMDPVPAFGAHADAVLRELGYLDADIRSLRADGVI